jgi:hypothetical protein
MSDALIELRFFTVEPGTREEFHRVSREGTIPLMRRLGIEVLSFGPALNDDDGYLLVRRFGSEEERVKLGAALYEAPEWAEFDQPVGAMIADYRTVVRPEPLL